MKTARIGAPLVAALSLLLLSACGGTEDASAVSAEALVATCDDACVAAISTLADQTAKATFTSRSAEKDELGLLGKLQLGADKVCTGKPADAVQKLQDYLTQVQRLICAGKIAPSAELDAEGNPVVTPEMLVAGAKGAILCINPAYLFTDFVCP